MNTSQRETKIEHRIIPITVVVPVKNEERNLAACLKQLTRFEFIIVVDSQSTDGTKKIAEEFGAEVLNFVWDGKFPKKRNWTLRNHRFQTEWVMFLDADEVVNEAFCAEVERNISSSQHVGFWLNYTNYFMGKKLRHGLAQRKLALFKVNAGEYEKIQENSWSRLDMEVHEHPILDGTVGEIAARIDHRDFRGLDRFLARHLDYAKWEAERYKELRRRLSERTFTLTNRQRLKYKSIDKAWFALMYFCYTYFIKLGFLDGRAGLHYAAYKRWYFQTVRNLILERSEPSHRND